MKKLVLLSAVVFAMTFASCKTDPAATSASTSAPASTENVQSTPAEEATSTVASENKDAAEVSENKDVAAPAVEQATEEKTEETKPEA